jgi:GntR family transcriptional regulator/MocR family aminotransferase
VAAPPTNLAWQTLFDLSTAGRGPLHVRLTTAIRAAIRSGRLPRGAALPPSRALATDLGVSRWTVTEAYAQLVTEGYLLARTGSATRVNWSPEPDDDRPARRAAPATNPPPARYDMDPCRSDLRAFPRRKWVEAVRTAAETTPYNQLNYSEPGGLPRLRALIAEHLNRSRGAAAEPGTVSVFSGAAQAMLYVSRALVAAGCPAIGVENPGSERLWQAARTAGLDLVPLPVDDDGLVVDALADHPALRAVCVGPTHQSATGCVLATHRRAALLAWARRADALVVEDDYDAEFSYTGPALPVMQGTDPDRVALLGSMSKSLGPTVGIGWAVTPRRWVDAVRSAHEVPLLPPVLNQAALAYFMESGGYDRHLRASRQRFRARRAALVAALARHLPGCRIRGADGGLHLLLDLPAGTDAAAVVAEALRRDLQVYNLDEMRFQPDPDAPAILVGYSNLTDAVVDEAVAVLAGVVRQVAARRGTPG